jgi:hypothetical protein
MGRDVWWRLEFIYLRQAGKPWKVLLTDLGVDGDIKTDFKLMECDPVFWVQKARHRFQWRILVNRGFESSGSVASGLVFDQRSKE